MNKRTNRWWQRPEAFLFAWDFGGDRARFLEVGRRTFEASGFLDHRIAADRSRLRDVPAGEILETPIADSAPTPGFVFHTAFCCSTLLARSLDLPGRSLVLREPVTLLQLADIKRGLRTAGHPVEALLTATLALLARPFAATERVVLKPTNLANNLATDLLALSPRAHALVLYDELEPFLLSVLKRPREGEYGIEQFLIRLVPDAQGHGETVPELRKATLARRAALAWALQIRALRSWLGHAGKRVRTLTAGELLARPTTALTAAAKWLGVELAADEAAAISSGPLWRHHAKNPHIAFDPERREAERNLARRLLAAPIADGIGFAADVLKVTRADFPPQSRLLP